MQEGLGRKKKRRQESDTYTRTCVCVCVYVCALTTGNELLLLKRRGKNTHFSLFFFCSSLCFVLCFRFQVSMFMVEGMGGGGSICRCLIHVKALYYCYFFYLPARTFFLCVCCHVSATQKQTNKTNKEKPLFFFSSADGIGFKRRRKEELKKKEP